MLRVSIAVADDHPILLEGLSGLFAGNDGYEVVGKASSAADALSLVSAKKPDLVVLDMFMPGSCLETIASIQKVSPNTRIVIFTASASIDSAVNALDAGATGYVLKGSPGEELHEALRCVMAGGTFITPSFAAKVISALRNPPKAAAPVPGLNVREGQIVKLLFRGCTNKEIAYQLRLREKTVKHYMTLLMQKLHARNRVEVVLAMKQWQENPGSTIGERMPVN